MNRLSCLHIGALVLAIGAAGCFASPSDETNTARERERAPQLVSSGSHQGGSGQDPVPMLLNSHTDPGTEAMGPQPDPWQARAHSDNGGPQPDPWNGNDDETSNGTQGPRPNPNPTK